MQALGLTGLAELKQALLALVDRTPTPADALRRTLGELGKDTDRAIEAAIDAHDEAIEHLGSRAARARIAAAVAILHPAARIAISGFGPSAALAVYVATLLARGGRRTLTLNASGSMLTDQMLDLGPGTRCSYWPTGAYGKVLMVFGEARQLGLPMVPVSDSFDRKLARFADVALRQRR